MSLMAKDEKKGLATMIIKSMKPSAEDVDNETSMESMHEAPRDENGDEILEDEHALDSAAEDIIAAMESKDVQSLKETLKAFVELMMMR